jgi:hypoxanthine phosphoribosyltransferase
MNIKKYSWDEAHHMCSVLGLMVQKPDLIIAVARGGLIPAALVANFLSVRRIYNIGIKSYLEPSLHDVPNVYQKIDSEAHLWAPDTNILVIDDILDTGSTFKYLHADLTEDKGFKNISYATLHYKVRNDINQYIPPNHVFVEEILQGTWVWYPWEVEEEELLNDEE